MSENESSSTDAQPGGENQQTIQPATPGDYPVVSQPDVTTNSAPRPGSHNQDSQATKES